MKTGFELLKKANTAKQSKIRVLEAKYELGLPPIYRIFCELFELGKFKYDMYSESGDGQDLNYCSQIYYKPKGIADYNIGITGLDDLESVFNNRKDMIGYGQNDIERELLRIAGIGGGGGIFVGVGDQNLDDIILHLWDEDPGYEKLADNIFEFVIDIVSEPLSQDEYPEVNYSRLYKKWGEDFWRVRRDDEST